MKAIYLFDNDVETLEELADELNTPVEFLVDDILAYLDIEDFKASYEN